MKKSLLTIVSLIAAAFSYAQSCSELFFSEVDEGSGNNKAIEVYNPTSSPVVLSNYRIVRFSNGSTVGTDSLLLNGTLGPHSVWVVVNGQTVSQTNSPACDTALQAMANQLGGVYPDPLYENGNDAIVLVKINPRTFVDIFGKIGEDPGYSWTDVFPYTDAQGAYWTENHSLIRKASVTGGVTVNPTAFNVTVEWDSLPENTWTNLGIHNSTCGATGIHEAAMTASTVNAYPNPSNGTFTVASAANINSVQIYNALGELVFTQRFSTSENQQQIDLSTQGSGLYFMQVELATGRRVTSKISIR